MKRTYTSHCGYSRIRNPHKKKIEAASKKPIVGMVYTIDQISSLGRELPFSFFEFQQIIKVVVTAVSKKEVVVCHHGSYATVPRDLFKRCTKVSVTINHFSDSARRFARTKLRKSGVDVITIKTGSNH